MPHWWRSVIARRYASSFALAVALPMLAYGVITASMNWRQQREMLASLQSAQAEAAALQLLHFLSTIETQLGTLTVLPWQPDSAPSRRLESLRVLRQVPAITDLVLLDGAGRERVAESRLELSRIDSGAERAASPAFAGARARGTYYGDVTFRKGSEPFMTVAVGGGSADTGVAIAEVNLKHIWNVVSRISVGSAGLAYVVDRGGRLIAHPDINFVLRNTDLAASSQLLEAAEATRPGPAMLRMMGTRGEPVLASSRLVNPVGWRVVIEQPESEVNAPLWAAARAALGVTAASLLLAIAAALWSAWRLARPLGTLTQGVQRIGAGQLTYRIELDSGDELQQLGERFNAMAAELQGSYAGLERQVAERTRELSEANQAKSRLLAAASHDLRQPLHALNLMVAQLHREADSAVRQRLGQQIAQAIQAINGLFDALLDVSKLDAGVVQPERRCFPMQMLLDRMDMTWSAAARDKGLDLRIRPTTGWTESDPALLERIVGNLVGNAVRYTRRGGIVVGCRRRGDVWRVSVWDTGIGIAEAEQARIFDEFYQVERGGTDAHEGLGLGLSIVARLTALLAHPLHWRSQPGRGSCFTVSVPAVAASAVGAGVEVASGVGDLRGKQIWLVDNNDGVLQSTGELLRNWGCCVQAFACLPADALAIRAASKAAPDALLVDMHLDGGDTGVAVVARIRAHFGREIPAMVMTGDVTLATRQRIAAAGLPQVEKPVSALRLRTAIARLLQRG